MSVSVLTNIGPYRLVHLLGEGGMGQVYLAKRIFTGGLERTCVIKAIRPDKTSNPEYARMFFREAKILASLHHQNIVQVLDFDQSGGFLYLAMEHIDGRDLQTIFNRLAQCRERLPLEASLRITAEVLRGLDYAQRRTDEKGNSLGIIHRDLSANNILISREGEVKIVDFGLAKSIKMVDSLTQTGVVKGKLHYLAPEQIEGEGIIDLRTDLYSVGVVLYEMLTGFKPYRAINVLNLIAKIVHGDYLPVSSVPDVPQELDRVLAHTLACNPNDRYGSAAEMLEDIENILSRMTPTHSGIIRECYLKLFGQEDQPRESEIAPDSLVASTVVPVPPEISKQQAHTITLAIDSRQNKRINITYIGLLVTAIVVVVVLASLLIGKRMGGPSAVAPSMPPVTKNTLAPTPVPEPLPTPQPAAVSAPEIVPTPTMQKPEPLATPTPNKNVMPAKPGFLLVGDLSPYADIYVDGTFMDTTPSKKISLRPGKHKIKLINPKMDKKTSFTLMIESEKTVAIGSWPQ